MSYILDALRRAQAERDRGQVPGLSAQPLASVASVAAAQRPRWVVPAIAVLLLMGAGFALWVWRSDSAAPTVASTPSAPAPSLMGLPAPAAPATPAAALRAPPLPVVVSVPNPAPPPAHKASGAAPAATAESPSPAVLPLSALSADQRRSLPPLLVSGSVWSANSASRFVMVNGQVVHEGETAAPGVILEHIDAKSMRVAWRGLRIDVPF